MSETNERQLVGPNNFPIPADYRDIVKVLPHRYPFLLVDRVLEAEPGKTMRAIKNVSANEAHFQGHFPDFPVMPGVLQLEALAQTMALLCALSLDLGDTPKVPFLMSMEKVKFRRPVVPGDQLELRAEVVTLKSSLAKVQCQALVDGQKASEALITAAIRDMPTD